MPDVRIDRLEQTQAVLLVFDSRQLVGRRRAHPVQVRHRRFSVVRSTRSDFACRSDDVAVHAQRGHVHDPAMNEASGQVGRRMKVVLQARTNEMRRVPRRHATVFRLRPSVDASDGPFEDLFRNEQAERAFGTGKNLKLVNVDAERDVRDGVQRDRSSQKLARRETRVDEALVESRLPRVVRGRNHVAPIVCSTVGCRQANHVVTPLQILRDAHQAVQDRDS